jgi:hypothetical protein
MFTCKDVITDLDYALLHVSESKQNFNQRTFSIVLIEVFYDTLLSFFIGANFAGQHGKYEHNETDL